MGERQSGAGSLSMGKLREGFSTGYVLSRLDARRVRVLGILCKGTLAYAFRSPHFSAMCLGVAVRGASVQVPRFVRSLFSVGS